MNTENTSNSNETPPFLIRMLINILCNIPKIGPAFDKDMLMEKAKLVSPQSVYFVVALTLIAASPLFFALSLPTSFYVSHINIRNLAVEFIKDHLFIYYAVLFVIAAEIFVAFKIFKRCDTSYKIIMAVVSIAQFFFIVAFCMVAAKEAKYLCGPIHSNKLYQPHELFVSGKYDDALKEAANLKQSKEWHHLVFEINDMENRVNAAQSYGKELEKRILDLAGQKNYLQLLDLLVFQRKIDPGNTSTMSYVDVIDAEYKKTIQNLASGVNLTTHTFSDDEIILRKFLLNRPLGIMKYDSLLLVEAFNSRSKTDAIKYVMNEVLITKWINEARYKP
jgi:hypothetical protein